MSRRRHTNPSDKAKQSRVYRRNQRDQKRFEAPLRVFIEVKYKSIFQEYVALYKQMDADKPYKIDLRKTESFKRWKRANEQLNSDIQSLAIRETIEQDHSETNNRDNEYEANNSDKEYEANNSDNEYEANNSDKEYEANNSDNEYEANNSDKEYEANNSDNEYEANNSDKEYEANNSDNKYETSTENQRDQNEGMLAAQQVDALVNEMIIDEELRALLNTEPEDDEGIELNIEDEVDVDYSLDVDFEPFDYRLEVETLNW